MRLNKPTILILLALSTFVLHAQDIQLSQFYANPLHLNPGFAGSAHQHRATLHQRIQWPGLEAKYLTTLASYDRYFDKYNSGFGFLIMQDYRGTSTISSTSIDFMYSYELHVSENLTFRPGLQLGFSTRNLDYSRLTFPSMFDDEGQISSNPSTNIDGSRVYYGDVGAGLIMYTETVWLSFSGLHLNTPNLTILGQDDELPVKGTLVGGYKIDLTHKEKKKSTIGYDKNVFITPTFHYKFQGKFDQLDLGCYATLDFITAGFWYRGIPFKKFVSTETNDTFSNNESLVFIIGTKIDVWSVSYSYDYILSGLSDVSPGGSHEINLTYVHRKYNKKKRPMKRLPCPKFFNY